MADKPTMTERGGYYNFYVEGPVSRALAMLGIDKQEVINQYARARHEGLFDTYKGTGADPDKKDKSGMLRISMPHIQAMLKSGQYNPELMKQIGMTAKRSWAGYKGSDADTPWGKGGGAGGSSKEKRWGAGGKNPVDVKTPPGDPWNANNWNPYTPMTGFVQGFQPWNPISFSLDPSLQGTQPTFQPGGWLDPVPQWNPNAQPWPNFPNPSPPPNVIPSGGGGGGNSSEQFMAMLESLGMTGFWGPDDPNGPTNLQGQPNSINQWWLPNQRGDQLENIASGLPGSRWPDALDTLWNSINTFYGYQPWDIGDSWGGSGSGRRGGYGGGGWGMAWGPAGPPYYLF